MSFHSAPATPVRASTYAKSARATLSKGSNIPSRNLPSRRQMKETLETNRYNNYNPEKEPIKAYLRIRSKPENHTSTENPYIQIIDDTEVSMTPPENSNAYRTRHKASERYRFTKVFGDSTDQCNLFNETALGLVKDVLQGQNALLFAYGVTNSGKTYTVMGKENEHAGLLPRALNTIFNSIGDRKSEAKVKPVMHSLIQRYEQGTEEGRHILETCSARPSISLTEDKVEIDPNYEYGIWVSYIEIYNEHVYDLLDTSAKTAQKRPQLQLKYEQRSGNKYVSDMTLIKVRSMEEADAVVRLGQQNRQVFSTLMNQASSRSHSIFTVHVLRCPVDSSNYVIEDPNYTTLSKLSVVDLAGSERYRNTNSTGQRLKEAGNINKSLMVLGQCMEVLRLNQMKADMGRNPTMVPFRHSKLTEIFKSTFEGDGKAAIIINVNPYDTGYDENNHVMKFAAVAKDVTTWRQIQPKFDLQHVHIGSKRPRNVFPETSLSDDDEQDTAENDQWVDGLILELEDLWDKWVDAETRASTMEFDVREQVSREMDIELRKMEDMYLLALKRENDMMSIQLKTRTQDESQEDVDKDLLNKLKERQEAVLEELDALRNKIKEFDATKKSLQDRISELEQENQKERETSQCLASEVERYKAIYEQQAHRSEDDDDEDMMKANADSPKGQDAFKSFLALRKQLRRSVFKKEELCKDADTIMNQVEQFDGVTFQLAKETKMGKLLKLIAQEDFEKDPYQIRNRAIKLFKRYAQLPTTAKTTIDSPTDVPKTAFSNMNLDSMDMQSLKAENAKLKQKIKSLNNGQKRLKKAFEKTRLVRQISEDVSMADDMSVEPEQPTNDKEDTSEDISSFSSSSLVIQTDENPSTKVSSDEEDNDDDNDNSYESDITEMLRQNKRQKRRRRLRAR